MTAELTVLKRRIEAVIADSPLNGQAALVSVEPGQGETGEFLRITVSLKHAERLPYDQLEAVLEQIEDAIIAVDERSPSVRFEEAA